ncbi:MAG TPA: hypothetical protein VFX53_12750 [Pedococcus sp.]|jgi:hypothetical protein|nr:hypothetical protein [Pedococcus sp.]
MSTSHRLAKSVRNVFARTVPGPPPAPSNTSGNTVALDSPTARGRQRLLATGAAVAAVTAAVVATSAPAHADVTVMRAGLACGYNRVYAYAPSPDYTRSTLAGVELDTRAELYRWDRYSSTWQRVAQSGWWAYTITDYAGRPGTPVPNAHWATYGNRGTSYYQFAATPGYAYAVKSYVYDRGDRTTRYTWNYTNVTNTASSKSCWTG